MKDLAGCAIGSSNALVLAKALGVLPRNVRIIGAQPAECDELRIGLSSPVRKAAEAVVAQVRDLVREWLEASPSCSPAAERG